MSRVTIVADSLTTAEVRAALVAVNRLARENPGYRPSDDGMALVGLNGPDHWRLQSPPVSAAAAIGIAEAIARASWAGKAGRQEAGLAAEVAS